MVENEREPKTKTNQTNPGANREKAMQWVIKITLEIVNHIQVSERL